jgi:hypothetical protein
MQRILLDQIGANTGKITFGQRAQSLKKQIRNSQTQHRVTQKFKAFVVISRKAAVRHGTTQQGWIGEVMLQPVLQRGQSISHAIWFDLRT